MTHRPTTGSASQSNPIHVVLFAPWAHRVFDGTATSLGGAEVDLRNISAELAGHGDLRVTVACVGRFSAFEANPSVTGASGPVRVVPLPAPPAPGGNGLLLRLRIVLYWWRLYRALVRLRFDVLMTKPASMETGIALLACERTRRPAVYRIAHDWETAADTLRDHVFLGNRRLADWFRRRMARAAVVLAQTRRQQDALAANFGIASDVLPNSHRISDSDPQATPENRALLWVGRIHPMKNAEALLEAAARFPHLPFRAVAMVNFGFEAYFDEIRTRAGTLANMDWSGGLPSTAMKMEYARARLFLLTSHAEGFANVLIEAMGAGLPVASLHVNPDGLYGTVADLPPPSPEGGALDVDGPAWPGWCAEGSPENYARIIERLTSDGGLWRRTADCARTTARARFSTAANGPRYAALIRRLAGTAL